MHFTTRSARPTFLADASERFEAVYDEVEEPISPRYFYVTSTMHTGRELEEPTGEDDRVPTQERQPRRNAIDAVLALRAAVDEAIGAVSGISDYMDGAYESVDQRWPTRTIGQLRILRGEILRGHARDLSRLPCR